MEFETVYNSTYLYLGISCMLTVVLMTLAVIVASSVVSTRKAQLRLLYLIASVGAILGCMGFGFLVGSTDINALENNLKKKYEISSLVKDSEDYPVKLKSADESPVLVILGDGREAVFNLTQDFSNQEPTLHTVPSTVDVDSIKK